MEFKNKTVEELLTWLESKGYDEWIRGVFEENEVDGHAFLLLTKKHMKELVTRVGPRVKLIEEQAAIRKLNSDNVAKDTCKEDVGDNNDTKCDDDHCHSDHNVDDQCHADHNDGNDEDDRDDDKGDCNDDDDKGVCDGDTGMAEQNTMLCSDKNEQKELQQNNVMELDFPKEYDDETLIVKKASQLNSDAADKICEEFAEDDDDSVILPSAMSTDDDFNATAFPSDTSTDYNAYQSKKSKKKKLKKPPKKHRKASIDSDSCSTDCDESLLSDHYRVMNKLPGQNQKASNSSDTSWININDGEILMTDDCNLMGVKKPKRKLQRKDSTPKKKKRKSGSLLPRPFHLPKHFPKVVKSEISTGFLSGKARSRLILTVANAVFDYASYPTREDYDHVARQIVKKYQFMSDDKGSHEYLVRLLEDKLTYLRTCKTKQKNQYHRSKKRSPFVFSPRPPILQPPGDYDDNSAMYEMNLRMLQKEEEKPNPNKEVVLDLMEKTFFIRRQNILKTTTSVASLLKTFPSLKNHIQIIAEFNRIMGRDIHAMYSDCWKTLMHNVLAVAAKEKDNVQVQSAIQVAGRIHSLSDGHKSILALYCLCYLLREVSLKPDHQCIITFIPENTDIRYVACDVVTEGPTIVVRGSIFRAKDAFLVVEKEVLFRLLSMTEAVLILLASFYVFNKRHEGILSNLFIFLEYSIMGHSIPKKKTRVHNFLAQLAHVNDRNHE